MSFVSPDPSSVRPDGLHSTRSFIRMDTSSTSPFARARAKTIQTYVTLTAADSDTFPLSLSQDHGDPELEPDVFEKRNSTDPELHATTGQGEQLLKRSVSIEDADELPIELISLTDR
jgi:hypothetical protein